MDVGGQIADLGMLLADEPDVPKHQGITWFAIDMHQPGVEVRPLREMTGAAMFNEVFLTDAVVDDDARIGDTNNGWAVANTTLLWERSGMGAGGGAPVRGALMALPGTIAGHLEQRAGDFVSPARSGGNGNRRPRSTGAKPYIDLARSVGRNDEPAIRQDLARLHTLSEIARYNTERHKAVRAAGGDIPGIANFSKLNMADLVRLSRDLGMELLGGAACCTRTTTRTARSW